MAGSVKVGRLILSVKVEWLVGRLVESFRVGRFVRRLVGSLVVSV